MTNKNKELKDLNKNDFNEKDKKTNICIYPYSKNTTIDNENMEVNNILDNIKNKLDNIKNKTIYSKGSENKFNIHYINEYANKSLRVKYRKNKINTNLSNYCKKDHKTNSGFKEIKFELINLPKKYLFSKKLRKVIRPFSAYKANSSLLNIKNNNKNSINLFNL